ncbi:phage tail tape measure protein [Ruminococcus sp.]|uniref:phage tail tape measure protein n=1 Tax=Ruminococcus sp. TaxID=41978 RepID=UPI0025F26927|nr:phage tail tape measure protein [Ruminococcus sp.]
MSDFRVRIVAELDTSKIPSSIKKIEKEKIVLNNFTLNTKGLGAKIQQALNGQKFTLNLTNVKVDNLSTQIAGQMRNAGNQAGQQFSQSMLNKINSQINNGGIDASIAKVTQKFNQLNTAVDNMGSGSNTTALRDKLKSLENEFRTLHTLQKEFTKGNMSEGELISKYEKFNSTLLKIKNSMTVVSAETKQFASAMEVATLRNKMESWLNNNTKAAKVYGTQIQNCINKLDHLSAQGNVFTADANQIAADFKRVDMAAESAGLKGKSFGSSISGAFKSITRYVGVSTLIYSAFNAIKSGVQDVVSLDTALVDLQKTTDATSNQLKEFYFSANDIAKQLGATTEEVIQAAADWSRLGYSIKDAQTMAKVSSIFSSISPDIDIEKATDGLVSAMKAFNIEADDALDGIASKINAIGNSQAVSNGDIVEFLTRSSSAMKEANNTLEETIALGTAATEITRDAASVGNALKTVSMRIRGYDEETGEFIDGVAELEGDIADLTKSAEHPLGVSLFKDDAKTEFKSTTELLRDISDVYDELTDKQQAGLLEKLAGKRQGQIVAAILNNFSAVENSLETMTNSAGSAMNEMNIIEQSLEFKLNALKETAVGVFQNLFQTDEMGAVIDILTDLLEIFDSLTENLGLFGTALVGIGITAFIKNFD